MALERASQSAQEAGPLHDDHRAFGQPPVALLIEAINDLFKKYAKRPIA
jgi:hypothetical protein